MSTDSRLQPGRVVKGIGPLLEHRETARAGNCMFIHANAPNVAVNRGPPAAVVIGVRNEPTAQESFVMLPELDGLVPWAQA
jgi:uncharacterized RmlC-like cupin family protein